MTKKYSLILDDGQTVIVPADSHKSEPLKFSLYRLDGEAQQHLIGAYTRIKGWHILDDRERTF